MELKCPHCGKSFTVDESDYSNIVKQIRDHEFNEELSNIKKHLEQEKESAIKLAVNENKNELEKRIAELEGDLKAAEANKKIAVNEALEEKKTEINELKNKLSQLKTQSELKLQAELNKEKEEYKAIFDDYKASTEQKLKEKDSELDYYKNLKLNMSTKMVGESLERHCEDDYNMHLRSVLPEAYFEKDNEISETGSKGDFIFREKKDDVELLSIMFEMKNEMDTTENKHKNEYFFKELDKDRKEKKCEYAVLVSMLEADSEYYNQGIVDVSHKYEKMYVIRPQFLCPLITLLRNAALNAHSYKTELADVRAQNIDVSNFEDELEKFKLAFGKNCEQTSKRFKDAIDQIDKSIKDLEKVKEALTMSEKHMIAADNKLEDLTIKKLTKNSPVMRAAFEEVKKDK